MHHSSKSWRAGHHWPLQVISAWSYTIMPISLSSLVCLWVLYLVGRGLRETQEISVVPSTTGTPRKQDSAAASEGMCGCCKATA